jgi:hypothetical protein
MTQGRCANRLERASGWVAALLMASAAACATAQETPAVRIYDAGELPLERYVVLKRIWTGTWRASFWVPSYPDAPAAIDALQSQAAGAGADGVINLHCLNDAGWGGGYHCYGLAIELK